MKNFNIFTAEEINLICIYDTSGRQTVIDGINGSLPHTDDSEMTELMQSAIRKLDNMTDEEYGETALFPAI